MNVIKCEFGGCDRKNKKESNMCGYHKRYNGLNIQEYKICNRCSSPIKLPYELTRCEKCNEENRDFLKSKNSFGECQEIKKNGVICGSKVKEKDGIFCVRHMKLQEKIKKKENDMNENIRRCKSHYRCDGINKGTKAILPNNYPYEKCVNCRNRSRTEEEKYEGVDICIDKTQSGESCNNRIAYKEYGLCASHYKSMMLKKQLRDEKEKGILRCSSHTNCGLDSHEKAILPNNEFRHCEYCRKIERMSNKEHNKQEIEKHKKEDEQLENHRGCWTCCNIFEEKEFLNSKGEYGNHCAKCRETRAKKEQERDRKGREISEEAKETKKIWRMNHPDKIKEYLDKHRQTEHYKNRQDERNRILREYRTNNPEKFYRYNETRRQDIEYKLSYYKSRAKELKFEWNITDEYALQLFSEPCFYCNQYNDYNINGIDRVKNVFGYNENNVVSCCTECNMIKCDMDVTIFLNKVEHILTYNKIINGSLYKFDGDGKKTFRMKLMEANEREIYIDITEQIFNEISKNPCYICGKENSDYHSNGIDRVDNFKNYIKNNIQSCCGNCNYMKGELKLSYFIFKLFQIYEQTYGQNDHDEKSWLKNRLNIHLKFIKIIGKTLKAENEIHPRRKIKNKQLEKLIQDNKDVINIGSLNFKIFELYKKLDNNEITIEELIKEVEMFIENSRKKKKEKNDNNFEFSADIEKICQPYKNLGKFRQFVSSIKKQIINKEKTYTETEIKEKIEKYIKNNISKDDRFEFSVESQQLIKKYKKHGKFRNFLNRYKKKVINEKISESQQLIDIQKYINEYVNQ